MATNAVKAFGTHLYRGNSDGPPETFTQLNEVTNFGDGPIMTGDEQEVSNDDSPGQVREYIRTWRTPNEFTITKNWIVANPTDINLLADEAAGTAINWKYVYSNGAYDIFPAYVKTIKKLKGLEGALQLEITFRLTGEVTSG